MPYPHVFSFCFLFFSLPNSLFLDSFKIVEFVVLKVGLPYWPQPKVVCDHGELYMIGISYLICHSPNMWMTLRWTYMFVGSFQQCKVNPHPSKLMGTQTNCYNIYLHEFINPSPNLLPFFQHNWQRISEEWNIF
jgi:hypothetical protein